MKISLLEFLDNGKGLKHKPNKIWIEDSDIQWTFQKFYELTWSIADNLLLNNTLKNIPIAVLLPNSAWVIACDFGILRTGNPYMNLDNSLPDERIFSLLENVQPSIIITDDAWLNKLKTRGFTNVYHIDKLANSNTNEQKSSVNSIDTDPVCLITTSGSTGIPKAVALTHRGLIDFAEWFDNTFDFDDTEVVGSLSPLFFDGYFPGLLMSLLHGAQFKIIPRNLAMFPSQLAEKINDLGITFIFWVPSTLVPFSTYKILDNLLLSKLRFVGFAGEVMPTNALIYLIDKLPHAKFVNFYGPVEISVICTYYEVPKILPKNEPIPIGIPCKNTDIIILNESDELAKIGEAGELCVKGSSLALGYWNNSEKTNLSFVKNPLQKFYPELIYRTGDIVSMDSRNLISFIGRKDFQIKHQGFRIDLAEIEHAINNLEYIKQSCVLYDKANKDIILVYESDQEIDNGTLRKNLLKYLPKYMLPTKLYKIELFPLNPNGKIDRKKLDSEFIKT